VVIEAVKLNSKAVHFVSKKLQCDKDINKFIRMNKNLENLL